MLTYMLSYMQGDRQTYEHVVPEGMGLEAFCAREVETMGIEADEPQVRALTLTLTTDPNPSPSLNPNPDPNPSPSPNLDPDEPQVQALASALDLRVRVEYLDGSSHHRHVICGPELLRAEAGQAQSGATWRELAICLLFRPGHYDVLVPLDWAAAAAPDTASFVPPAP